MKRHTPLYDLTTQYQPAHERQRQRLRLLDTTTTTVPTEVTKRQRTRPTVDTADGTYQTQRDFGFPCVYDLHACMGNVLMIFTTRFARKTGRDDAADLWPVQAIPPNWIGMI